MTVAKAVGGDETLKTLDLGAQSQSGLKVLRGGGTFELESEVLDDGGDVAFEDFDDLADLGTVLSLLNITIRVREFLDVGGTGGAETQVSVEAGTFAEALGHAERD